MRDSNAHILLQETISVRSYSEFSAIADIYGSKAAGLMLLPLTWCPKFVGISSSVYRDWQQDKGFDPTLAREIDKWLALVRPDASSGFILRSSGVRESIGQRGKHLSTCLHQNVGVTEIQETAAAIFMHAQERGEHGELALVLQRYVEPEITGHLSNERHVSPTRNQWRYETEKPAWGPPEGINSKFAPPLNPAEVIRSPKGIPRQALRSLGNWINSRVLPRCHLEWLVNAGQVWVVQVDLEWEETDEGVDPTEEESTFESARLPDSSVARIFLPYALGTPTPWPKLDNLRDFDFVGREGPKLYFTTAEKLLATIDGGGDQTLA